MSSLTHEDIIKATAAFVETSLSTAEGGHDWWHIYRVWKNALHILEHEQGADRLIVELGALLHDIADSKFYEGDEEIGPRTARAFLESLELDEYLIEQVEQIIRHISFKGSLSEEERWTSPELMIVQDADRLDAIGAIGIARTFNFGGFKGRPLYDPHIAPNLGMSKDEYKKNDSPTLNHFYEKLLLLKDKMNTATGKKIAEDRHRFMEQYLEQFYAEWEGAR
ncbi:MAG TPA: HD domain-containing protein [Candidatus Paceibacterota bacterium]